ncbi:MAG: tetratricopeptide repeat protein, partial [Candidatus Binatus sp.]
MPPTTHRRKLTQKELRAPDEFTTLVENARDFFVNNLTQVIVSTAVVVLAGAIVIGVYYYERHRDNLAAARFYDAITALNAGHNKAAETQFKQLAEQEPGRRLGQLARFYLASAYIADGDLPDARDSLVAFLAEERDPLFRSLALSNLAVVYERMSDWKKAAGAYQQAAADPGPEQARAELGAARMLAKAGDK